jgi:hypothetical protein
MTTGGTQVLIDASHKRLVLHTVAATVVLIAVYGVSHSSSPEGMTGRSTLGIWYGLIGFAFVVIAGLLALLKKAPAWWWIGRRREWLKAHIWLGLLSVVVLLCHSGFRLGGLVEQLLWLAFGLTVGTGLLGVLLQQFVPRMMTARFSWEAPYDQIPQVVMRLQQEADQILDQVWQDQITGASLASQDSRVDVAAGSRPAGGSPSTNRIGPSSQTGLGAKEQLQEFYDRQVRPFLSQSFQRGALLANPLRAEAAFAALRALPGLAQVKHLLTDLEQLCEERRQLAEQERLHHLLHAWLLVHVPASVALLALGVAHAVAAVYF